MKYKDKVAKIKLLYTELQEPIGLGVGLGVIGMSMNMLPDLGNKYTPEERGS